MLTNWFSKRPLPAHLQTGIWGEKVAARMLKKKGYRILGKRVRIGKHDELDIVARDRDELVFIEVKTRAPSPTGRPMDAVDANKQRMLSRAAATYLGRLKAKPKCFRFDVVEIVGQLGDKNPKITHIESAFSMRGKYHIQW